MSTAYRFQLISVEDYLAGELVSAIRHEYVAGEVFAMTGARVKHNRIAGNVFLSLGVQLRGKPCRPYGADMKIRIDSNNSTRFYYPDVSVVCDSTPDSELFQDKPVVVVEVLSESTRRNDLEGKRDAYLTIPSLTYYVLLEQDAIAAMVYERQGDEFACRRYLSAEDRIVLETIGAELPLAEVYADVFDKPAE